MLLKNSFLGLLLFVNAVQTRPNLDSLRNLIEREPKNTRLKLELGVALHDRGVQGDKEAINEGLSVLEPILKKDSSQVRVMAYIGSLYTLKARESFFPWNKMKHSKHGFSMLDRAVSLKPGNMEIRLVRAVNSLMVPGFLGRLDLCFEDFNVILGNQEFTEWAPEKRAYVYWQFGMAHEKKDKKQLARTYYHKAIDIAPNSNAAQQSRHLIERVD